MATRFPCSGSYRAHLAGEGDGYTNCPRCGEVVHEDRLELAGGQWVCPDCIAVALEADAEAEPDTTEDTQ